MNIKNLLITILVIVVIVGATGGEQSAAAVGNAVGEALHLIRVAWNAMVNSSGG